MSWVTGKGSYIRGEFLQGQGALLSSHNPSQDSVVIFNTTTDETHVDLAVESALSALYSWTSLPLEARIHVMLRLKDRFIAHEQTIARAISQEMGKPLWESTIEAKSLSARIDLMIQDGLKRVATEKPKGVLGEARYHAQGVLVVLGPYNFPAHLVNAHVIPALLTGNTVVVKPSEICPYVGELYAQCMHEAGLPAGVFNMVQGGGPIGQALVSHPKTHGVLFTGSYATGRRIAEALLDQPGKIAALEMGGKNFAVVLNDADIQQALIEVVQGAFLTTGQRCTATSRVLLTRRIAHGFIESLTHLVERLSPCDPFDPTSIFGPLASQQACNQYVHHMGRVKELGVDVLVPSRRLGHGAFVKPSLHFLQNAQQLAGYTDVELFGPDLCVQIVEDLEEAIQIVNQSPYGLSNAVFTANKNHFEHFFYHTRSGVLNLNKSTNGALGCLPFGGLGKSGNQRAAGIDAVRYTTYPVAINFGVFGEHQPVSVLKPVFESIKSHTKKPHQQTPHVEFVSITPSNWNQYAKAVLALERQTFEVGRQDTHETLQTWIDNPDSICLVMLVGEKEHQRVMGYAFGGPLELSHVDGALQDPMRGLHHTFMSANIVVSQELRGFHLGTKIKSEQIKRVSALRTIEGLPRYLYMVGRNRVGHTSEMTHINRSFGAQTVAIYDNQYGIPGAKALYYRIDLRSLELT